MKCLLYKVFLSLDFDRVSAPSLLYSNSLRSLLSLDSSLSTLYYPSTNTKDLFHEGTLTLKEMSDLAPPKLGVSCGPHI